MSETKLCISCMLPTPASAPHCPHCNYDGTQQNEDYALPIGSRVGESYVVGKMIGCDGEVISYVGYDILGRRRVEIKEYAPRNGSHRSGALVVASEGAEIHFKNGLSDFRDLYEGLKKASAAQSALIGVSDIVAVNNTAYAVCEYFDGMPLDVFLSEKDEPVTFKQALLVFSPVLDALSAIHAQKLIHRGVSPHTILVKKDGTVKLSGYATAAVRTKGTEYPAQLFEGFSAPEQYMPNSFISPAADIYALAACMYYAFTKKAPPDAQKRRLLDSTESIASLRDDLPESAVKAINSGLILDEKQRASSVKAFSAMFTGERRAADRAKNRAKAETSADGADESSAEDRLLSRLKIIAGCAIGLLVVSAIVFFSWEWYEYKNELPDDPEPVAPTALVVPDLAGLNIYSDDIRYDDNYKYVISFFFSSTTEADIIISTTPSAGSALEKGGTVTVNVSKGVQVVEVPNVVGLSPVYAGAILEEAGIIEYGVQYGTSDTAIPGTVYAQSVAAGTDFYPGSEIIILMAVPAIEISAPVGDDAETSE